MAELTRKALALGFPSTQFLRTKNDLDMKSLLVWLDDIAFRQCTQPHLRTQLLAAQLGDAFVTEYLAQLGCPHALSPAAERELLVDWMLGQAVQIRAVAADDTMDRDVPSAASTEALAQLCAVADVPVSGDAASMTRALANVLSKKLNYFNVVRAQTAIAMGLPQETWASKTADEIWEGEPFPLGFESGDATVDKLATVLRMLYVGDLRELQWNVNEVIALCQALTITALDDPRANLRLKHGRHGR